MVKAKDRKEIMRNAEYCMRKGSVGKAFCAIFQFVLYFYSLIC